MLEALVGLTMEFCTSVFSAKIAWNFFSIAALKKSVLYASLRACTCACGCGGQRSMPDALLLLFLDKVSH